MFCVRSRFAVFAIALASLASYAQAREWTDSTGKFTVEAELIAFSPDTVFLKQAEHKLVSVPIDKLSKKDQEYLKSKEAEEISQHSAEGEQTWTMESGLKVIGRVFDYARKPVVVQRRWGKIYVNDRLFDNLSDIYQQMIPKIVSHFEQIPIANKEELLAWAIKQKGRPKEFMCEGVMLELEDGDIYGVPFFFFSEEDRKILEPGWERWLAVQKDLEKQQQESFALQAQAQAYQQDRMANQQATRLQLELLATAAGVTDMWEVRLFPRQGFAAPPVSVIVPGRNSQQATQAALSQYPNYTAGPVRKLN